MIKSSSSEASLTESLLSPRAYRDDDGIRHSLTLSEGRLATPYRWSGGLRAAEVAAERKAKAQHATMNRAVASVVAVLVVLGLAMSLFSRESSQDVGELKYGSDPSRQIYEGVLPPADTKPLDDASPPLQASSSFPSSSHTSNSFSHLSTIEALDQAFCSRSPCRIIFVGGIAEGESKAQLHLSSLLSFAHNFRHGEYLAVLPKVDNGIFGSCRANPFEFYYDVSRIESEWGVKTASLGKFEDWLQRRGELGKVPTSQNVVLIEPPNPFERPNLIVHQDEIEGEGEEGQNSGPHMTSSYGKVLDACLKGKLDNSRHSSVELWGGSFWWKSQRKTEEYAEFWVDSLSSETALLKYWKSSGEEETPVFPEVLTMFIAARTQIFPKPSTDGKFRPGLPYSPMWYNEARRISSQLSPFISVHWRMETVVPSNLLDCSKQLHTAIRSFSTRYPDIGNVFLLTDYPLESDDHPHSLTLKIDPLTREAMRYFLDHFDDSTQRIGATGKLNLTTLTRELPFVELGTGVEGSHATRVPIGDVDMGLVGVMDKIIAEEAEIFLVGIPKVCGRFSSFSQAVVTSRREQADEVIGVEGIGTQDGRKRRNVVDYWPRLKRGAKAFY